MALTKQISRRSMVLSPTTEEVAVNQTLAPNYQWVVNGELSYPVETALDALHLNDSAYTIHEVRVSARVSGDSQYRIKLIKRDSSGLNAETLVNNVVVFSSDREIYALTISNASVPQNSSLEVTITEEVVGSTPAQDLTINLVGEDFASFTPVREGHVIQNSAGSALPQEANLQFDSSFILSDDIANSRTKVSLNALVQNTLQPIGSIVDSVLTEAEFQSLKGVEWVLADGRDITGSDLATLKGWTNLPDYRGKFTRMTVDVADALVADTDVNTGTDEVTVTSHSYSTGFRVRLTGTVPGGLSTGTSYFIIVVDANTVQFASSYSNAVAGTFITLTSAPGSFTIVQWEDPNKSARYQFESDDLGGLQDDEVGPHTHQHQGASTAGGFTNRVSGSGSSGFFTGNGAILSNGTDETRPRNRYVNKFIKINNIV